jgi:23S rRNA (adenine2030-N6)-methyltransferase
MLPPVERRGLMLIDPPFEAADEFDKLARAVKHALRRFAIGCYAIWYPIKDDEAVAGFVAGLAGLKAVTLELRLPPSAEGKLSACGLAVINPPWKFEEAMAEALPWVGAALGATTAMATVPA